MGLRGKIFLSSLATVAGLGLAVMWLLQMQTLSNFADYRRAHLQMQAEQLSQQLSQRYTEVNNWDGVMREAWRWPDIFPPQRRSKTKEQRRRPPPGGPPHPVRDRGPSAESKPNQARHVFMVFDHDKAPLSRGRWPVEDLLLTPIRAENKIIGWLGYQEPGDASHPLDQRFAQQQRQSFWALAICGLALAGLSAWLLAGQLLKRLQQLLHAVAQVRRGELRVKLGEKPGDEFGQLMAAFEDMTSALQQSQQRQGDWLADIAHELRTPLAVLRGELEALIDGVRPLNHQALSSLHDETRHLNRLVDDLHLLSSAQNQSLRINLQPLDLDTFLADVLAHRKAELQAARIEVDVNIETGSSFRADPQRLRQVLDNLIENAIRYASGAKLEIHCYTQQQMQCIDFIDQGPGVEPQHLPRLFDRLYRVDDSRSKASGGSGLGLAICRSIVEAHGGTIDARAHTPQGLHIHTQWPL